MCASSLDASAVGSRDTAWTAREVVTIRLCLLSSFARDMATSRQACGTTSTERVMPGRILDELCSGRLLSDRRKIGVDVSVVCEKSPIRGVDELVVGFHRLWP